MSTERSQPPGPQRLSDALGLWICGQCACGAPGRLPWKTRAAFPTARPFAHKLHSPQPIIERSQLKTDRSEANLFRHGPQTPPARRSRQRPPRHDVEHLHYNALNTHRASLRGQHRRKHRSTSSEYAQTSKGTPYTASGIRGAIGFAAEEVGLAPPRKPGQKKPSASGFTAKDLRAYASSSANKEGYSLEQLKAALAHTSVTTTEGYVQQHTTPISEVSLKLPKRPD